MWQRWRVSPCSGFSWGRRRTGRLRSCSLSCITKTRCSTSLKLTTSPPHRGIWSKINTFQIIILQKISVPVDFTRGYCGNSKCSLTLQQTLLGQLVCSSTRAAKLKLFGERKQYLWSDFMLHTESRAQKRQMSINVEKGLWMFFFPNLFFFMNTFG